METRVIENSRIDFRKIAKHEPDWMYRLRKSSWESYNDQPMPERITNVWRYTKPEYFIASEPQTLMMIAPSLSAGDISDQNPIGEKYSAVVHSQDDGRIFVKIAPELLEAGVILKDLHSAAGQYDHLAGRYFGRLVGGEFGKFEALNLAVWNSGIFLFVPDNVTIEKPILFNRHFAGPFTTARLLAVIGKNSQVTLIDDYSGGRMQEPIVNSAVEIFGDDFSRVRYVSLQRLAENNISYITERAEIGRSAMMNSIFGALGSSISKVNAGVVLNGKGSDSRMYGLLFGNSKQHFDYHTMHHHKQSESLSNINFKVILKDKATSAYTGLIRIEKETVNCEAYQENRNLLLNRGTKAESIPELEIMTDQVRCTHGATMGPIDPEMLFYLESRGIKRDEAVKTVVSGFVEPTINQMPMDLQGMIREMVKTKLEGDLK